MNDPKNNKQRTNANEPPGLHDFELRSVGEYFRMIRERWFIGLLCAVLVSAAVGYFFMQQPIVYQSEASLMVERESERVVEMRQVVDTGLDGQMWHAMLENHIKQLTSRTFRNHVLESFSEEESQRIVAPYSESGEDGYVPSVDEALGGLEVDNLPNSFVLRVRVRHRDPEVAALVADRFVDRYMDYVRERRQSGNETAIEFLTEREGELRKSVHEAERALQEYRRDHNLVSVEENQNIIAQRLISINQSLTNARIARLDLESRLRQVERLRENAGNLLELSDVSALGYTQELANELGELRQRRKIMSERYLERHPQMVSNAREIEAVAVQPHENERDLVGELQEAERDSLELDRLRIDYSSLQRAATVAQDTHSQIADQLSQVEITSRLQNSNLRIVDRASVSSTPVEPNLTKVALLAMFFAGFMFVGAPIGLGVLDRRLKGPAEVELFLGQRLVGQVTAVRRMKEVQRAHLVEDDLDDNAAESFRGIFSQLQVSASQEYPKAMMLTSTLPGEGKSFIVSNLSYCFAAHGKRTLMIDFDLRRPGLHRLFKQSNSAGLLRWLQEGASYNGSALENEALGIVEVAPDLFLLPAGGNTKRASEMINNVAVAWLLNRLKEEFDVVVIDTPPLGIFPDAQVLGRLVDESLYVVRFSKVDREQVRNFLNRLAEVGPGLLGVVMNGMPTGGRYAHYYSGYGGGNYKYAKYYAQAR